MQWALKLATSSYCKYQISCYLTVSAILTGVDTERDTELLCCLEEITVTECLSSNIPLMICDLISDLFISCVLQPFLFL